MSLPEQAARWLCEELMNEGPWEGLSPQRQDWYLGVTRRMCRELGVQQPHPWRPLDRLWPRKRRHFMRKPDRV